MTPRSSSKRAYTSTRRAEQARQTKRQILGSARELFAARGYAGATMEAIAERAGVAVETVYATFGSKRAILSTLVDVTLVGDDLPIPILERPNPQAVLQGTDQVRQIEVFVQDMSSIMARMAPLFDIMRIAAKTEPDIAELLKSILKSRADNMMVVARALMKNGALREGVTARQAADTLWALTSAELFILLNIERGWSAEQYRQWLTDSLTRLLLP